MLDAAAILAEAAVKTGVADSDPAVAGNLARLIESLRRTGKLSTEGAAQTQRQFVTDQVNRLEGLKWIAQYPTIAAQPVTAPVFLMGLPRSGTTYFQYLFDRDPRFQLIRTWQSTMPSPPPRLFPETVAPRRAAWVEARRSHPSFAGFEALHLYDQDGSDECHAFLQQSYGAAGLNNLYRVPDYFDYLLDEADLVATYRIHKRQLQLLQHGLEAKPWALKYPNHVLAMEAILAVYPDARFVMTHRDPVQTLASIAKMTFNLRGIRASGPIDPFQVGQDMRHFIQRHVDRIMAFDRGADGGRVVHVDYYALVRDPVAQMRRIHKGLGIDTPDDVAQAVGAWHAGNPKNARGANAYTLEQWGLADGEIADQFSTYMHRFAIPREHEGLAAG
jgi:hypothetical protein